MLPKSFWFGLAVAGACGCLTRGAAVGSNNDRGYGNGSRSLLEIITTTACSNIGLVKNYQARLDLVYTYSLEYSGVLDLLGVERAIATSVASALNTCGDANQPIYAVALSEYSAHHLIVTGKRSSFHSIVS